MAIEATCPSSGFTRVQDWMKDVQIGFRGSAERALSSGKVIEVQERHPNGTVYRSSRWSQDLRWAMVLTRGATGQESSVLYRFLGDGGYYSVEVDTHRARLFGTDRQLLIHAELSHESLGWFAGCQQYFVVTSPTPDAKNVEMLRYKLSIFSGLWVVFKE